MTPPLGHGVLLSPDTDVRLPEGTAHQVWLGSKHATTALVVATFPLLFLLDIPMDGLSPVLPGLAALMLALLVLPFVLSEIAARRMRGHEDATQRIHRRARRARHVRTLAWVWFVLWFVLGV